MDDTLHTRRAWACRPTLGAGAVGSCPAVDVRKLYGNGKIAEEW